MEMFLVNGDFVPDRRGIPRACHGAEDVVSRALLCLCGKKGGFSLLPSLGSRLHTLRAGPPDRLSLEAAALVREALEPVEDVSVEDVSALATGSALEIALRLVLDGGEYKIKVGVPLD